MGASESYYPLDDTVDLFKVDCRLIGKTGYERVKGNYIGMYGCEEVDGWVRASCWHVLMFHGIGNAKDGWWPIPLAEFEREMARLAEIREGGEAEVITFKKAAQRINNSVTA